MKIALLLPALSLIILFGNSIPSYGQDANPGITQDNFRKFSTAQEVFTAKLTKVIPGPVGLSNPPLFTFKLQFEVNKVFRGSLKKGKTITGNYSIRQKGQPTFPVGKECVVALSKNRGGLRVDSVQQAKAELVDRVKLACSVPVGWMLKGDKLVSPWAVFGKNSWPKKFKGKGNILCSVTGRPPLMVGANVEFRVEKVPPKKKVKFGNPDGDGEYKITVKNVGEKPAIIPALLSDAKNTLWNESLVIVCQKKAYPVPGSKGIKGYVQPTILQPGEEVSTVVNALKLQGPDWPRGGYRIEFRFALGEMSETESFYYLSRHHDPIRAKLVGGEGKK